MKSNIFFLVIISLGILLTAFGITTYRYYQALHSDDPIDPYVMLDKGILTITRWDIAIDLSQGESYGLQEKDIVITGEQSLATIYWPDHSTTRLGEKSRLIIEKMRVADDYSSIELVASLESGKSWSNIIRTLYPGSQIQFRVPKQGLVAGVRGTVFDINISENYIRSEDHAVNIVNSRGDNVTLLPGEAVKIDDILKKITKRLDSAWVQLNQQWDRTYNTFRSQELQKTYSFLSLQSTGVINIWERFVRFILSWFSPFRDLEIFQLLREGADITQVELTTSSLMKWYQIFQSKDFVQERDVIRGKIVGLKNSFSHPDALMDTLTRGAIYDRSFFSGVTLQSSDALIDLYSKKAGTTFESVLEQVWSLDTQQISDEWRTLFQRLLR